MSMLMCYTLCFVLACVCVYVASEDARSLGNCATGINELFGFNEEFCNKV